MIGMMEVAENTVCWFAMSAPYQKELEAQRLLERASIESFVPMCYKVMARNGKKHRAWLPAVSNLIFVRTTKPLIQETKRHIPFLQYLTRPESGRNIPIIVPDDQMTQFIAVCRSREEKLVYLTGDEVSRLGKGTPVRILGGVFDGVKGSFVRMKGCRSKRVVVQVQGIVAVVLAEVQPDLIEVIE